MFAPFADKLVEAPSQRGLAEAEIVTFGVGLTVTVKLVVPVHPDVVALTVYNVVMVGETMIEFELPRPLSHWYEAAPLAVKVVEFELQIGFAEADIDTPGFEFTIKVILAVSEQNPLMPIAV